MDGLFGGNHLLWCAAKVYCAGFFGFWVGPPGSGFAEPVVDFVDAGSFGNGAYVCECGDGVVGVDLAAVIFDDGGESVGHFAASSACDWPSCGLSECGEE